MDFAAYRHGVHRRSRAAPGIFAVRTWRMTCRVAWFCCSSTTRRPGGPSQPN